MNYVLFDLETTGFNRSRDAIIQIAAVRSDGQAVTTDKPFCTLVRPHLPVPEDITKLTGVTAEAAAAAPQLYEALPAFFEFAGDGVLVAHNAARFDMRFLRVCAGRLRPPPAARVVRYLDTVALSRELHPSDDSHSLDAVAAHYGIPLPANRHDALADTLLLAEVFHLMLREIGDPASFVQEATLPPAVSATEGC